MDTKQAIKLLHNNQYQKHLGNGEYDYIHQLTDAEAKAIESLLEWQERMIEKICQFIGENIQPTNPCPPNVEEKCDGDAEGACVRCWRRWLEQEAGK